ncbi:MAG: DNA cytosine methyltransferase [Caulobacteraceae bacterium]
MSDLSYYEFFAGGGMARAGLGEGWACLLANDFDPMKARAYAENWGGEHMVCEDVTALSTSDLPGLPELVWASFPCQDLSLAGDYRGLGHRDDKTNTRSGTFWPFWRLMEALQREGRAPNLIVLENVLGVLTSSGGSDFAAISSVLANGGYRFGAVVIDARWFVAQSRPRVFIVAVREDVPIPTELVAGKPVERWTPPMLRAAHARLAPQLRDKWLWWSVPEPGRTPPCFADLLEEEPEGVSWHDASETRKLLDSMSAVNRQKVKVAVAAQRRIVGTVYRRTRPDPHGGNSVRAEVRFDDVAGCLRTPAGGSSRQKLLIVEGKKARTRLLSPREAARLMGLPDTYKLPKRYNDAYRVAGDGVVVPVVRHLAATLLEPLARAARETIAVAAE